MAENDEISIQSRNSINEERLNLHSYDLIIFPRYLENLPSRVSIEAKNSENNCDVYAIYIGDDGKLNYKFAQLIADENGAKTSENKIYTAIHNTFKIEKSLGEYIGFRGCGRFPIAPLMLVAFSYKKYGRGIFKDGEYLPTPCAQIELKYGVEIMSVRTNAPLR